MSTPEQTLRMRFGLKPDFPFERLLGFFFSIGALVFLRPYIEAYVPSPYYSITVDGDDFIIFTELSIWTLILMTFITFLTLVFIIPLALYFRGLSEWEWDPTVVVFWLIMTRGFSLFFSEIADTNANLEHYTLILINVVDSVFVIFMTVFLLNAPCMMKPCSPI